MVDFETEAMTTGSLLFLQPGQVHRFGDLSGCDGWLLVFKAELLPARAESADARSVPTSRWTNSNWGGWATCSAAICGSRPRRDAR